MNRDFDIEALKYEMEMLDRGKRLARLVRDPEWGTIPAILADYRDKAGAALSALPPGDPNVITAHAAWSALTDLCAKFEDDINRFLSAKPSDELKAYLAQVTEQIDPLRVMDRG